MYEKNKVVKYFMKSLVTLIKISRDYVFRFLKGVNSFEIFIVFALLAEQYEYQSAK